MNLITLINSKKKLDLEKIIKECEEKKSDHFDHIELSEKKYRPKTREELDVIIKDICEKKINDSLDVIDTSLITDFSNLFVNYKKINFKGIGSWDVSKAVNMRSMFSRTNIHEYEYELESWDVSNVLNMQSMFYETEITGEFLNKWKLLALPNMKGMFENCPNILLRHNGECVENVESDSFYDYFWICDSHYFFQDSIARCYVTPGTPILKPASSLFVPKNRLELSSLVRGAIPSSKRNQICLGDIDIYYVTNLSGLFKTAGASYEREYFFGPTLFQLDWAQLSNWDVSRVTNMKEMFLNCDCTYDICGVNPKKFNGFSIRDWDVSNVTDMSEMFKGCGSLESEYLSNWNVSNVINMSHMFEHCHINGDGLENWDVSNVTDMTGMFYGCSFFTGNSISNWNVSKVKNMEKLFSYCRSLSADNMNWNVDSAENMRNMFSDCKKFRGNTINFFNLHDPDLSKIFVNCPTLTGEGLAKWDVSNVTNMEGMFENCISFTGEALTDWNVSNVTNMEGMFENCISFTGEALTDWNVSNVKNMNWMFRNCKKLKSNGLAKWDVSNVINMIDMFENCISFTGEALTDWNVSNVTYMRGLFKGCSSLNDTGFQNWDVSSVRDMSELFMDCKHLISKGLSKWNVSKVKFMEAMFKKCTSLTGEGLIGWNVSNVTDMKQMFEDCSSLKDTCFYNWDVSSVENMSEMFKDCKNLESEGLSKWNVSKVCDMTAMFENCTSLSGDFICWNPCLVKSFDRLFHNCTALTANNLIFKTFLKNTSTSRMFLGCKNLEGKGLSTWDVSNIEYMVEMFGGCSKFTGESISDWDVSNVKNMNWMFKDCISLKGENLMKWPINIDHPDIKNKMLEGIFDNCQNLGKSPLRIKGKIKPKSREELDKLIRKIFLGKANFELENLDISNITNLSFLFCNIPISYDPDSNLLYPKDSVLGNNSREIQYTNIPQNGLVNFQGLSQWDTSHVKTMRGMFAGTKNINNFKNEIKGWNVKNVIDMEYMFYDCGDEILQDISSWEVSENCKINNIFAEKISNLKVKQEPVSLPQKKNHHVKLLVSDGRAFSQLLDEARCYNEILKESPNDYSQKIILRLIYSNI